ncbi:MAG: hypothetical protein LBB81_00185 [Treponema sp.]|jgi:hypothetical protein|nr:hypothetical protein [Treponema sp.]
MEDKIMDKNLNPLTRSEYKDIFPEMMALRLASITIYLTIDELGFDPDIITEKQN